MEGEYQCFFLGDNFSLKVIKGDILEIWFIFFMKYFLLLSDFSSSLLERIKIEITLKDLYLSVFCSYYSFLILFDLSIQYIYLGSRVVNPSWSFGLALGFWIALIIFLVLLGLVSLVSAFSLVVLFMLGRWFRDFSILKT